MRNTLRQSLESIDFQSGGLFAELTMAMEALKKLSAKDIPDSQEGTNLSKIIAHHTNVDVVFDFGTVGPAVEVPAIHRNNVLVTEFMREYVSSSDGLQMIAKADGLVRGSVNLARSSVSGVFTEVKNRIHFPIKCIVGDKFTAQELAAVVLHELGHVFTYFEFLSRTVTTNQVLSGLSKALGKCDTAKDREIVLINAKKALRLKNLDTEQLSKSTHDKVIEAVVVTNVIEDCRSELGVSIYDYNSWEYLSDQFASRHGAGRHIVTALDKIYRGSWNISFRSLPAYLAFEAIKLVMIIVSVPISLLLFSMDSDPVIYDTPGDRFKRVRNQIVENLKDQSLDKQTIEALKADLVAIDQICSAVNDRRQFFGVVIDFVTSSGKQRDYKLLQRDLEDMAANELFVKAQELKHLA